MCILYGTWWQASSAVPIEAQSCVAAAGFGSVDAEGVAHGMPFNWPAPTR
jgi:hypothetical protein